LGALLLGETQGGREESNPKVFARVGNGENGGRRGNMLSIACNLFFLLGSSGRVLTGGPPETNRELDLFRKGKEREPKNHRVLPILFYLKGRKKRGWGRSA